MAAGETGLAKWTEGAVLSQTLMPVSTLKADLERLRAELDALAQRAESSLESQDASFIPLPGQNSSSTRTSEILDHVAEFLKELRKDVSESKTSALAASFLAGVFVGKMMSK